MPRDRLVPRQPEHTNLIAHLIRVTAIRIQNPDPVAENPDPSPSSAIPVTYRRQISSHAERVNCVRVLPGSRAVAIHKPETGTVDANLVHIRSSVPVVDHRQIARLPEKIEFRGRRVV